MTSGIPAEFNKEAPAATSLRRFGQPTDMVGVALHLASQASADVTDAVIPVDGGYATTL
jgi:NAD(P)-dependent dehydrogenase (short-subunit alcohol dehydrogenase family)